jgi:hypothetical protein
MLSGVGIRRSSLLPCAALVLVTSAVGCGENKRDVFLRGLEIENAAEKGPCRLHYAENAQAASLTGDAVADCLRETERAMVEYDRAAALGLSKDPEFMEVYERATVRRGRLESMLKHVRAMETSQMVDSR